MPRELIALRQGLRVPGNWHGIVSESRVVRVDDY